MGVILLLDTHVFLWAVMEPDKLSSYAIRLIENDENELLVSAATTWEIATKHRLGKLPNVYHIVHHYKQTLAHLRADTLPITYIHALKSGSWEVSHRDPFDRMLAAQAYCEKIPLISADTALDSFDISRIW